MTSDGYENVIDVEHVRKVDEARSRRLRQQQLEDDMRARMREMLERMLEEVPKGKAPTLTGQLSGLERPEMMRLHRHLMGLEQRGKKVVSGAIREAARRAVKAVMKPMPKITVPEFVEHPVLGWEVSEGPIKGKVRIRNQNIAWSVLLTMNEPGVNNVAVVMSPQMCKTFILMIMYAYAAAIMNTTVMIVMPNDGEVKKFVQGKLDIMIKDFPWIRRVVNVKKNGIYFKRWNGGFGIQTNAGSDTNLGGKTIQIVLVDEVDKMVNTKSGDPVDLAFKRSLSFKDSGFNYQSCTPTHEKGRIWQAYLAGDRRRYFIRCPDPECGHEQVPIWSHEPKPDQPMENLFIRWEEDGTDSPIPGTCHYHCQKCQRPFGEAERLAALMQGLARQTRSFNCCGELQDPMETRTWDHEHWPGIGYAMCRHHRLESGALNPKCRSVQRPAIENLPGSAVTNRRASFHGWHAQAQTISMDELADNYKKSTWRSFMNNNLGLPFLDSEVTALEAETLADRLERYYSARALNDRTVTLTAGIDTQRGYLALVVLGWGVGKECWLVHYEEIGRDLPWGDTMRDAVWSQLDERLSRTWRTKEGRELRIESCAIDTGGGEGRTERAKSWAWARQERMLGVAAAKGRGIAPQYVLAINGARNEDGLNFKDPFPPNVKKLDRTTFPVGRLALNAEILDMLANDRVGPGYCHFTADAIQEHPTRAKNWHIGEFFRMLTAEHKEIDEDTGKAKWVKDRERNEVFDCYAYALSAYYAIGVFTKGFNIEKRAARLGIAQIVTNDEREATRMSIRAKSATDEAVSRMVDVKPRTVVKRPHRRPVRMPVVIKPRR